jgi:hypothetical protein
MRKAKTLLAVYLAYMLEYRAELFLWALAGLLPLILMGVWVEGRPGRGLPPLLGGVRPLLPHGLPGAPGHGGLGGVGV